MAKYKCDMCFKEVSEGTDLTHLSLYVINRTGIWVCFECQLDLVDAVKKIQIKNSKAIVRN